MKELTRSTSITVALGLSAFLLWFLFSFLSVSAAYQVSPIKHPNIQESTVHQAKLHNSVSINEYQEISIIVDDFVPQPYEGEILFFYNRLDGDRGQLGDAQFEWGSESVTATINSGNWGGLWTSFQHPIHETNPVDFSAIMPEQINPEYQNTVTGLQVQVADSSSNNRLKIELKDEQANLLKWSTEVTLTGGTQQLHFSLPPITNTTSLLWFMEDANAGDFVVMDQIALTVTNNITDISKAAFVWSYGMLLNNWDANTGLVRDQGRSASGEFDAVQSSGALAAATGIAAQLGVVSEVNAVQIVTNISNTLLTELPRYHGLWPHWVKLTPTNAFTIVNGTEWSSIDTVIAAISLLEAQTALGLDTNGTEVFIQEIDWNDLVGAPGISHGYSYEGELLPYTWDTFGGESWLMQLIYASATGQVAPMPYSDPPAANGSGFIDELAWLFAPAPKTDYWGVDWQEYRSDAALTQVNYYSNNYPGHCFDQLSLFGLSTSEVPLPSAVPSPQIYQAFGVGGRFAPANDGSVLMGEPVVVPHYVGLIASLQPEYAQRFWEYVFDQNLFTPLNNVESFMFHENETDCESIHWNHFKGSWNLSLQTLGWGRYLAEKQDQMPILWRSLTENEFLRSGYQILAPLPLYAISTDGASETYTNLPTLFTASYEPLNATSPITITWNDGIIGMSSVYEWDDPGNHTVIVTATNIGGSVVTETHSVLVRTQVFLPFIIIP